MPDRKSLVLTLWLTTSLALLASVMVAPSGLSTVSSRPDCHRRDFALPPGQATLHLDAAIATEVNPEVNALPFEIEEQDRVNAPDDPRVSFLIPCSFLKGPDRQSIARRPIRSHYPLRC